LWQQHRILHLVKRRVDRERHNGSRVTGLLAPIVSFSQSASRFYDRTVQGGFVMKRVGIGLVMALLVTLLIVSVAAAQVPNPYYYSYPYPYYTNNYYTGYTDGYYVGYGVGYNDGFYTGYGATQYWGPAYYPGIYTTYPVTPYQYTGYYPGYYPGQYYGVTYYGYYAW
jgi:hypothetical protein